MEMPASDRTGPIASPSRPSVKFTALPAPTMMKQPKSRKNQLRGRAAPLKNGNASIRSDWSDCEPVETVGQVHGVAGADDDEAAEEQEEPAQRQGRALEKWKCQHQIGLVRLRARRDRRSSSRRCRRRR